MPANNLIRRLMTRAFRAEKTAPIRKPSGPVGRRIEELEDRSLPAGSWTTLTNADPVGAGTMMLLTDGQVMAEGGGVSKNWEALTPNSSGSYINGTFSALASMSLQRLYFASNVLPSGKVLVVGGEYSGSSGSETDTNTGEVYNPVTNSWTATPNFPQGNYGDDPSVLLPNGNVLAGYVLGPQTYLYNPTSNSWSQTGTKLNNDQSDEETYVLLPDGSVLSYDVFASPSSGPGLAQRYYTSGPNAGTWQATGSVPVPLTGPSLGYELGPAFLLPNGNVFQIGANNQTVIYDPSTNTWATGPTVPGQPNGTGTAFGADDAPGVELPNGNVLFAEDESSPNIFTPPTHLFDFNPSTNTITDVTPTTPASLSSALAGSPAYIFRFLALPNGDVLLSDGGSQIWDYTPNVTPDSALAPTVTAIAANGSGFTLTGTQLTGASAGANYGDDAEMDTNYPVAELTSGTGIVAYGTTTNWTPGIQTGSTPVTTQFTMPSAFGPGAYLLNVEASGLASAGTLFLDMGAGANNLTLEVNPSNSNQVLVLQSGSQIASFAVGSFNQVIAVGDPGNDTLTIDESYGSPIPSGGVSYNGGGGTLDGLVVKGNGTQTASYTSSATTRGNGTIVTSGGTINFVNLTPVDITGMATATITFPNANDVVNVAAGFDYLSGGTHPALNVTGTSGGVGFEQAAFWNETNLVINTTTVAGTDAVTIASANNANLITNFTVTEPTTQAGIIIVNGAMSFPGAISLTAGQSITVNANITGGTGGTTLLADGVVGGGTTGVTVNTGDIVSATGSGSVSVSGTGSPGIGNSFGVVVNGGTITTGGTGSVTVTGNGGNGSGSSNDTGVFDNGTISSGGGNVQVIGQGGGTGTVGGAIGVIINSGATISATGAGAVSVMGTGGPGSGVGNLGVDDSGIITSGATGTVTVIGTGGSGAGNAGVFVDTGEITSGGTGSVTVTGNGGSGNVSSTYGVYDDIGTITSGGNGAVTVTGTGGSGNGGSNYGVFDYQATITSGGTGTVTVTGNGGSGTGNDNFGLYDQGTITSSGGNVLVTGTGGGSGAASQGYGVYSIGQIYAVGTGTVTVMGTGGSGSGGVNVGVLDGGTISSTNTTLNVTGDVGTATTGGIALATSGTAISAGSGNVNLTSSGALGGAITETSSAIVNTTGTLTTISVGGTTLTNANNVGSFNATNTTSGNISLTNTATLLTITGIAETGGGNVVVSDSGSISTSGAISAGGAGSVSLTASVSIVVGANITGGTSGTTLLADGTGGANTVGVTVESGDTVSATGAGPVSVTGTGGSGTGSDNYGVNDSGTISSGGGNVQVTGQGGGTQVAGNGYGVYVNDGTITSGGAGMVTLSGTGGAGLNGDNYGVNNSGTITSGGAGTVTVIGTGGSGSFEYNYGVANFATITSGGAGTVTVSGTGGTGLMAGFNYGVFDDGTITSDGGNVLVTGNGGGGEGFEVGVSVSSGEMITSGGNGSVSVTGTGSSEDVTGYEEYGVVDDGTITSGVNGAVSVTGTAGSGTGHDNNGIVMSPSGTITSGGSGTVIVLGTGGTSSGSASDLGVFIGGTISSGGGNVQVTGNGGGSGNSDGDYGVYLYGGAITSGGSGTVTVSGIGGTGTGGSNNGIRLDAGGIISSGGSGTVTVTGTAGTAPGGNATGVLVNQAGSEITSGGGNVSVTGFGGGSGLSGSYGVWVVNSGEITSGGTGTVTVTGIGGTGSDVDNAGVYDEGMIISPNSTLSITGDDLASIDFGIDLDTSGIAVSAGSGNINLTSNGVIYEASQSIISTTGVLTTSSVGGTLLNEANTVGGFNATNTTSGDITLTNSANPLTITGISQTGGGSVTVTNTGAVIISGAISAASGGDVSLSATGTMTISAPITGTETVNLSATGNMTISAPITGTETVNLTSSAGNITDAAAETVTGDLLNASAAAGVATSGATSIITAVNQLQASGGTVGVWVSNTGTSAPANLVIVGTGVQATGGPIILTTVGTLFETTGGAKIATTGSKVQISANSMTLGGTTSAVTTVTLNITGTAGTVTDNGPIIGTSATINAPVATGADTINLNDLNGTPFTVTGGSQSGLALNINDSTNARPTTYTVTSTQVTTSRPQTINYSGLSAGTLTLTTGSAGELINVNSTAAATSSVTAGNGINTFNITGSGLQAGSTNTFNGGNQIGNVGDTFNVAPSATAAITVNGNLPAAPASPGDTLAVSTGGAGASVSGTQVSIPGFNPITYATIETIDIISGPIVVTGGNNLILTPTGPTSGSYQLDSDPVVYFSGITSFTWNGGPGTDTMTINNAGGTLSVPVTYTASVGGASTLTVEGGSYAKGVNTATGAGAGTLQYSGAPSGNSGLITYSNLAPVLDTTTVTNYTINTFGSPDTINVVNGPNVSGTQTDEVNSTPDDTFELTDFANKTNVTVMGTDNDTATVNYTTAAVGLATLTVEASPTANVLATPATVATTINSPNNNSTVTIGNAGLLSGIQGPVTVLNTPAFSTLVIDDSADATAETASLTTTVIGGFTYGTLTGLGMGPSAFINYSTLDPTFGSFAGTPSVTINAGTGADTITVDQTAPAAVLTTNTTTINTDTGADTVNIQATSANEFYVITAAAGAGADTVNIGSLAPIESGGVLANINGPVEVDNAAGTTTLTIDDSGDTNAQAGAALVNATGSVSGTTYGALTGLGNPAEIAYAVSGPQAVKSVTINTSLNAGTTLLINQTNAATTAFTTSLNMNGPGGADTINAQATGANITYDVFFNSSTDTANVGSLAPTTTGGTLTNIQGTLQFNDFPAFFNLVIDDSGDTTARNAILNDTTVGGLAYGQLEASPNGLGNGAPIRYHIGDTNSVTVNGGPAGNTFTVNQPNTNTSSGTTINPGTGTNTINIEQLGPFNNYTINGQVNGTLAAANTINLGLANTTQGIDATVTVQGTSPATEVINLNDQADTNDDAIHVTSTQVGGGAYLGSVTPGGPFGTLIIGGLLNYDATTTTLNINAGTGANTFNVDSTGATGTASPAGTTITNGTTAGLSTWDINGDGLTGANVFNGSTAGGVDQFTLNSGPDVGGFGPGITGSSVLINGGAAITQSAYSPPPATPSAAAPAADTLTINGVTSEGSPPPVTDTLTSAAGGGNFTGLGTTVDVSNIAQESFVAAPGEDTSFTLVDATPGGAAGSITAPQTPQDGIVVAPTGPQSARAVLDNGPTAFSPVVYVSNIDGTFTVDGQASTDDTLAVVGPSDGAAGGIGGAPYYEPTTPSSASTITLSSTQVSVNNAGLGGALLPVNITPGSIVALFVIGGNQAGPVGDTFIATPSATLPIFVNGRNPAAPAIPGDTIDLNATGIAQVYQNPNDPSQLSFEDAATGGTITFTNIETVNVTSNIHQIDILGNLGYGATNGAADTPMQDTVDITGTTPPGGPGPDTYAAGTATLNGLAFGFQGISDLQVLIGQAPGQTQNDAVTITPYATSVNPWGTSVTVNEGLGAANTLTYIAAPGITNTTDLVVTGTAEGNLDAHGIGSNTSDQVVRFSNAETVTVNDGTNAGAFGDTLAIDLANGNASDTADFQFADPTGHTTPDITLLNTLSLATLLQVNMDSTDITALTVNGGATTDTLNVFDTSLPAGTSLPVSLILNGGLDTNNYNTLTINGVTGGPNTFFNVAGANPTSGIAVDLGRAVANYTNIQDPTFVGGGGTSADTLELTGSGTLSVTGTGPGAGTASITGQAGIAFSNFGTNSTIDMTGTGGSDVFSVSQPVGWGIPNVDVTESPASSTATLQVGGTSNSDTFTYDPTTATILVNDGTGTTGQTTYTATGISTFAANGAGGADNELTVTSYLPGNASLPSGTLGSIPQISYQNFQSIQVGALPTAGSFSAGPVNAGTPITIAVNPDVTVNTGSQPYTIVIIVPPTDGTAVVNAASLPGTPFPTITYTPNTNFLGTDTLSYVVYDANGQVSATAGVITISVLGIAHTPTVSVTNTQPVVDSEGSAVALSIVGALSPSANVGEVLSYAITGVPSNVTFNQGTNAGSGIWTFTAAQLSGLTITGMEGPATLDLTVYAVSTVTAGVGGVTAGEIAASPVNTATSAGVSLVVNVVVVDPTATISNNGPVNEGSPVTVSLTNPFSPSAPATAAAFHYSFALLPGDLVSSYNSASTTPSATFTFTTAGTYTVWGEIIDRDGGFTEYSATVTVDAIAHTPTVAVVSPLTGNEDAVIPINFTAALAADADPSEVLSLTISGVPVNAAPGAVSFVSLADGNTPIGTNTGGGVWTFTAAQIATIEAGELGIIVPNGPATLNLTFTATSTVTNPPTAAGTPATLSASAPLVVNVKTVNPTATFTNNGPVAAQSPVTVTLSDATDASPVAVAAGLHYSFALTQAGLATTYSAAGTASSAQFTLPNPGTFTLWGEVIDEDGAFTQYTTTVTVLDVAPTATGLSNTGPVIEGSPVTVALTNPTDVSPADVAAGLHYSFALLEGDLSSSYSSTTGTNSAPFTFPHYGTYTVWGRVIDQNGGFNDYQTTVTVQAIAHAPTVTVTSSVYATDGVAAPISITVTPSPNADPNEILTYEITGVNPQSTFNHGTNLGNGVWTFSQADLTGLMYTALFGPGANIPTVTVTSSVNPDVPANLQGPTSQLTATSTATIFIDVSVMSIYAVGAGPGGAPVVHVYSPSGDLIGSFYAYDPTFRGGVTVAVGDVNGDGIPDIITGTGPGGGPNVKVFDGRTFQQIDSFMALNSDFRGGINVAVGDVTGSGQNDIVVGAGNSGGPEVQVFSGPSFTSVIASFFAFSSSFRGGVHVAVADVNNSGHADIIAGAGNGGGPQVEVFDGQTLAMISSFFAYGSSEQGGVNVAAGELYGTGNVEILTGPGIGGGSALNIFNPLTGQLLQSITPFGPDPQTGLPLTNGLTVAVEGLNTNTPGGNNPVVLAGSGPDYSAEVSILSAKTLTPLNVILPFSGPDGVDFNGGVYVG